MNEYLLEVSCLSHSFTSGNRKVIALDDVSLSVRAGDTLAIVGESGSGKTTLAKCILGLYTPTAGRVVFKGRDIRERPESGARSFRRSVQYVFQNPFASLNPSMTVFQNVGRGMLVHGHVARHDLPVRVLECLEAVSLGIDHVYRFPNELSGGQRQRVAIARALAVEPELVILDEPTSALDVSVQAQILNLLIGLQEARRYTYVFITHNLAVARHVSERIAIMYSGRIVELGDTQSVFDRPAHPYTHVLFSAIPVANLDTERVRPSRDLGYGNGRPKRNGCVFSPRCPKCTQRCLDDGPMPRELGDNHLVACHYPDARWSTEQ